MAGLKTLTIAALLHDIGKIVQRAYGQKKPHYELGANYIKEANFNLPDLDEILNCVLYHHRHSLENANLPAGSLAYLVYEADNIAAGIDRRKREQQEEEGIDIYRPLESVFNLLGDSKNCDNFVFSVEMLDDRAGIINYPHARSSSDVKVYSQKYQWVLKKITAVLKRMDFNNDQTDSLLKLLEATTSYIPSSTLAVEINDIPLYDHLKLTAALAGCMYLYFNENRRNDYKKICFDDNRWRDEGAFLMVSGDLSGIQNFIYTVSSRGALRSLRARSFYLEFLLENIADEILCSLGLTRANLLYTGGGHFYLLLPATAQAESELERLAVKFNDWLLKNFGLALFLALAWEKCTANELRGESERNTGAIFNTLSSKLARAKLQRYNLQQLQQLVTPDSDVNRLRELGRECAVCHTSAAEIKMEILFEENMEICESCSRLLSLGGKLIQPPEQDRNRILLVEAEKKSANYLKIPGADGSTRYASLHNLERAENYLQQGNVQRIYTINRLFEGSNMATNLWLGEYAAANEQEGKTVDFETLAKRAHGIERIAVLRADVDGLGNIFNSGFGQGKDGSSYSTLTRYAVLSRSLSLFFKWHINQICKGIGIDRPFSLLSQPQKECQQRQLVITYSGGDDVFIVGAWNHVIELAVDLYRAFRKFSCDKLTFSAGIGFFRHDFPVYQMAELTGELEKMAKSRNGKNAIALFSLDYVVRDSNYSRIAHHLYGWDVFIKDVCEDKLFKLQQWFWFGGQNGSRPPGSIRIGQVFLYKLVQLAQDRLFGRDQCIPLARLAYLLGRLEVNQKDSEQVKTYQILRKNLFDWMLELQQCQQLLTALYLLIYLNRRRKGNGLH